METLQIRNDKNGRIWEFSNKLGNILVDGFHYVALFAIGAAIVWSAVFAFIEMTEHGRIAIDDILVLFIYLEFGAMVGIYFKTNHMPVRFLVYIAMTALTRMLIADMPVDHKPGVGILYITGSILLLALANLLVRYSSAKYPGAGPAADESARGRADSK